MDLIVIVIKGGINSEKILSSFGVGGLSTIFDCGVF